MNIDIKKVAKKMGKWGYRVNPDMDEWTDTMMGVLEEEYGFESKLIDEVERIQKKKHDEGDDND